MGVGTILHVNVVGFLAALEENLEPSLRDRPFVIANERAARAVVLDLSSEAHREGIRRGMSLAFARTRVPGLYVRGPRTELRASADAAVVRTCRAYTPLVEPSGAGHVFLDLAGTARLNGCPEDAVQKIRKEILETTGLQPALALSSSKTVSKVATRIFRPSGFVALSPCEESLILRRQPVGLLPGVGPSLLRCFALLGIEEIGDLASLSETEARALGPRGAELVARSRGVDSLPVDPNPPERRVSRAGVVLEPDTMDPEVLRRELTALALASAYSLRREGLGTRLARVDITYTDGPRSCASVRSVHILSRDDEIVRLALEALGRARTRRVRVRRLSLSLSEQDSAGPELDLFEADEGRFVRLQASLDRVRDRYGVAAITPAALLLSTIGGKRSALSSPAALAV